MNVRVTGRRTLEVFWSEQSWDDMYQRFTEYSVDSQTLGDLTITRRPPQK